MIKNSAKGMLDATQMAHLFLQQVITNHGMPETSCLS